MVRYTPTSTLASSATATDLTMPISVMGLPSSGSLTLLRAERTDDSVGNDSGTHRSPA